MISNVDGASCNPSEDARVHDWVRSCRFSFEPGETNPFLDRFSAKLLATMNDLGHPVGDPRDDTAALLTTGGLRKPDLMAPVPAVHRSGQVQTLDTTRRCSRSFISLRTSSTKRSSTSRRHSSTPNPGQRTSCSKGSQSTHTRCSSLRGDGVDR